MIGEPVFHQVWLVYLGLAILVATSLVMRRTALGVALHAGARRRCRSINRAVGDAAALWRRAVLGRDVGAAGCFISIGDIHTFTEGMTSGAGYLAIAAIIFGNWKIGRTAGRVPAVRRSECVAVPVADDRRPCADRAAGHVPYLLALVAVAGLIGRQTAPPALTQPFRR